MAIADTAIEIKGKGIRGGAQDHIITDEARELFEAIEKDGKYTEAEKLAAADIRANYKFTDAGRTLFADLLKNWALERGRATQAANREEEAKAEEVAKAAEEAKKEAKKKAKAAKKEGPKTTKIGGEELDSNLVKFALKCVEMNITKARAEMKDEEYSKGDMGGKQLIGKDDVAGLIEIVFEDGEYSELEKDTMAWIRHNIGMSDAAKKEWKSAYGKAAAAAKQK
jgi:hypothetical protein